MFPQPEAVLTSLSSGGKHAVEKEIGPNVEQNSSFLCYVLSRIPFRSFLFVSHISQAALELAMLQKIPDFPVSTSQMLG